jgi:transposase InsO family protein
MRQKSGPAKEPAEKVVKNIRLLTLHHRLETVLDHGQNMQHVRGAPYHPMTQGKIERWHQTLKNRILLENYYLPSDLEAQIKAFVADYNHLRYHESIGNLTPRRLLRTRPDYSDRKGKDKTTDNCKSPLAEPIASRITS